MANIQKTRAIILVTRPFKESSLFCSLLTQRFGKIKVLAKGVRRPKSRLCGALEPFTLSEIIFYKRESKEVYNLSTAEVIECFEETRKSPQKVKAAQVICEFFDKTLPMEEVDERIFMFFLSFLKNLDEAPESEARILALSYLWRALASAGVKPHLENCVRCHKPINFASKKIDFSIGAGGLVCEKHFDDTVIFLNPETVNTLRAIYINESIRMTEHSVSEIEKLIPDYLYYHLSNLALNSLKHLHKM